MTFDHDPIEALEVIMEPIRRSGVTISVGPCISGEFITLHRYDGGLRSPHTFATDADRLCVKKATKTFLSLAEEPRFTGQLQVYCIEGPTPALVLALRGAGKANTKHDNDGILFFSEELEDDGVWGVSRKEFKQKTLSENISDQVAARVEALFKARDLH